LIHKGRAAADFATHSHFFINFQLLKRRFELSKEATILKSTILKKQILTVDI